VRAYEAGAKTAEPWENAATVADGLRVPAAIGDFLILEAIRKSGGTAIAVEDAAILAAQQRIGRLEGIFVAPEAAATLAGLEALVADGRVRSDERIVLLVTGNGLKYTHLQADGG
jgi:threonine synthase